MATGASTADLAVILIDARKGVLPQTRRHSFIVALLGLRHVVVAVNKMDLVDWSQDVFDRIRADYEAFASRLDLPDIHFLPLSRALRRQRGRAQREAALVPRRAPARSPRERARRRRTATSPTCASRCST